MNQTARTTRKKKFKDWFDRDAAEALGSQIASASPQFDRDKFIRLAARDLAELEFTDRVKQFSDALAASLPQPLTEALGILTASLPAPLPDCESVTDGWLQWPVGQFIADHGLPEFERSMLAMIELTQRFSAEFAIRPFIEAMPEQVFAHLLTLTSHPSPHVRRWCSEGIRPRLPWGRRLKGLIEDPSPIWPVLEALKDDPEPYVLRSVANNVNDIAKDHPQLAIERCSAWASGSSDERAWVIRHGLRSLIKDGDPRALALLGYRPPVRLHVKLEVLPRRVSVGEEVQLQATLHSSSKKPQRLMVDYIVHFVRKNGRSSAKVFKWTQCTLAGGERRLLSKIHPLKATSVRSLYPGTHRIEVQINGQPLAGDRFELLVPASSTESE